MTTPDEAKRALLWTRELLLDIIHPSNNPKTMNECKLRASACLKHFPFLDADGSPLNFTPGFDLVAHLHRQREFSEQTFGAGARTAGILDHIRKELLEIEKEPGDLEEWVDVILLALDGAWRTGAMPSEVAEALTAKQAKNEKRQWPDHRTVPEGRAIEHVR